MKMKASLLLVRGCSYFSKEKYRVEEDEIDDSPTLRAPLLEQDPTKARDHGNVHLWTPVQRGRTMDDDDEMMMMKKKKKKVPKGFLVVYVGDEDDTQRRFVIPMSYLSTPSFRALIEKAAEEFGFQQAGALRIPCKEENFQEILRMLKGRMHNKLRRR